MPIEEKKTDEAPKEEGKLTRTQAEKELAELRKKQQGPGNCCQNHVRILELKAFLKG